MSTVGAYEAKTHFSALLEEVEKGEQVTITKHGRTIAKLIPATAVNQATKLNAIKTLLAFSKQHTLKADWKKLRDEGRK